MTEEAIPSVGSRERDDSAPDEGARSGSRRVHRLSRSIGAVRTIAAGRLILAAYWLLAFLLDPPESLPHPSITYGLLYAYCAYALVRVLLLWHTLHASRQWQIASHIIDLTVFAALTLLAEGAMSPFYLGFLFSLAVSYTHLTLPTTERV